MEFRPLKPRKRLSLIFTAIYGFGQVHFALTTAFSLWLLKKITDGFDQASYEMLVRMDQWSYTVLYVWVPIAILTMIVNSMWIFRANWNARVITGDLKEEYQTPWTTVFAHGIPFLGFFIPFKGFRQIETVSRLGPAVTSQEVGSGRAHALVFLVWLTWICGLILDRYAALSMRGEIIGESSLWALIFGSSTLALASVFFFIFIRKTSAGLEEALTGAQAAEVFGD